MKKLFFLTLILMSGIASSGFVLSDDKKTKSEEFSVGMYQVKESDLLKVFVEKSRDYPLTISMKDNRGKLLLEQKISRNKNKEAFVFDLSEVKDGTYELEFRNESKKEVRKVNVKSNSPRPENKKSLSFN